MTLAKPRSAPSWSRIARDHHVGPEARAVLAHAPAFVLEAAVSRGDLQLVLGPAARDGPADRTCEKWRPMISSRLVALDAFGAGVPGAHVAVGSSMKIA